VDRGAVVVKVELWAEIRRLKAVEHLSARQIAARLQCCGKTVKKALSLETPPDSRPKPRGSILDPHKPKIDALLAKYPDLSAVRVREEIARGEDGYQGEITLVRDYLRRVRPDRRRVYSEVVYEPGDAMQVDFGTCGKVEVGSTWRRVYVFVAVLCNSRMLYVEFALSQTRAVFLAGIVHAFEFFGGAVRRLVLDNLKPAVMRGSGRTAVFHPEFLALCGHYLVEPVACERRDPESKGGVESGVKYVKRNALAGRSEELTTLAAHEQLAVIWRDEVANVRVHATTRERPVDRFEREKAVLRPLPSIPFDTDEILPAVATPSARVRFDANRYSVEPTAARKVVTIRASRHEVVVLFEGREVGRHPRSYDRGQVIVRPEHELGKVAYRRRDRKSATEAAFAALGDVAAEFALRMLELPVKPTVQMRRILQLAGLYGRQDVVAAMSVALSLGSCDAAWVEQILLAERRRQQLPEPLPVMPRRKELLEEADLEEPDPGDYDRIFGIEEEE
jgi:transposase